MNNALTGAEAIGSFENARAGAKSIFALQQENASKQDGIRLMDLWQSCCDGQKI